MRRVEPRRHRRPRPVALASLLLAVLVPQVFAQGPGFTSPGMPGASDYGQSDRFSRDFNPAISLAADLLGDWLEVEDDDAASGADFDVRRADLLLASWIDPRAWTYLVLAYENDELELDELALHYVGLPGNHTLRGGRFFVDFGKQMQAHLEELATVDRPLVLRLYLGEELAGDGAQWDWWTPLGERTVLRTSVGLFAGLTAHRHGDHEESYEENGHAGLDPLVSERLDLDEVNGTVRVTALTELGPHGTLQVGGSLRAIPSFSYRDGDAIVDDLSNDVYGLDVTYGWLDATATRGFTLGGELLMQDGALAAELEDERIRVLDDRALGFYLWGEVKLGRYQSTGLQYSRAELPLVGLPTEAELDLWYTRFLSDFFRLRLGTTWLDGPERDALRLALQVTAYVGPHGHGLNW